MGRKRATGDIRKEAVDLVLQEADDGEHDLKEWLARSPEHVDEYLRTEALWQSLEDPELAAEIQAAAAGRSRPWRRLLAAAIVLASFALVAGWNWPRPEVHRAPAGEVKSVQLEDRSVVFLNSDSNLEIAYTENQRRLVLLSGEATFEVAKSLARPFIVECGSTRVIATGTEFAVSHEAGETKVTVIEGHVVVENDFDPSTGVPSAATPRAVTPGAGANAPADPSSRSERAASDPRHRLTAGQQLSLRPDHLPELSAFEVSPVAWRPTRLVVDTQPLEEVVATFNRLNVERIELARELRPRNVSGVFDSTDPKSLLGFLQTIDGVAIEYRADHEIFVRLDAGR